ncbi:hypothetical protein HUW46_05372 [Amycolatopsis sp. CA-230715]|nr:hypothetical protein HUW46_05372 [Amycolatopsis sp. CA-230715]
MLCNLDWWASHQRGTHNRPPPGTRVRITEPTPYNGREGTVTYYEGQWNSTIFPVRMDYIGMTHMFSTNDVTELAAPDTSSQPNQKKK